MSGATFYVSAAGVDIGSTLNPILISIAIRDGEGSKSDTLEIELDDGGRDIAFPPTNTPIEAGIGWEEGGQVAQFSGKVDKVTSTIARGGGRTLTISAKSEDSKGKPKERQERHHDKGKFSAVAKKFGEGSGLKVSVAPGIDLERDYWAMKGEDFLAWGTRMAKELGATFKVRGNQAVFAERSAGQSLGGQALPAIVVRPGEGGNLISGNISPDQDVDAWGKYQVRWYDPKKAKYRVEEAEARRKPGTAKHQHRKTEADQETAKRRAKSNAAEADRARGGGTVQIVGNPEAQAEASCIVTGWRPGIDGTYRIASAEHRLTRSAGYITTLELKQPDGAAGDDDRKAEKE